jgi:membrane-associated phospholipid phosphatase
MSWPGRRLHSRREFVGGLGLGAALGLAGTQGFDRWRPTGRLSEPWRLSERVRRAYELRRNAAAIQSARARPRNETNGDEDRYPTPFVCYSKGLPHSDTGEVDPAAHARLLRALSSGAPDDFRAVPMGGTVKQVNPQAAYTFGLQGADSHQFDLPAPPSFASAQAVADLGEVYWQAVLRDIPFARYTTDTRIVRACEDLSRFTAFNGPSESGGITPALLFRGSTAGDRVGPYTSQFLYQSVPHGVFTIEQRFRMPTPALDYASEHDEWLALQRGSERRRDLVLESERRFIRSGRDLARYVHRDYTFQAFLNAALVLLRFGEAYVTPNPYTPRACAIGPVPARLVTEAPFCTFGEPQILDAVTCVAKLALHAAWRQKWLLHRRPRPEEFAQRVDRALHDGASYPVHADLSRSSVLELLPARRFLLPMAYPEGSPTHPSYPAGHAAVAGACATVLKAFFREDAGYPAPVIPSDDGLQLRPLADADLTIGGELDKLASNISLGRNFAGVHYRSDAAAGLELGEAVALAYLSDARLCLTEEFSGFVLTDFEGHPVEI